MANGEWPKTCTTFQELYDALAALTEEERAQEMNLNYEEEGLENYYARVDKGGGSVNVKLKGIMPT